jgi:16S rRNA (cytidine1402-2'-O)-methyltransferase
MEWHGKSGMTVVKINMLYFVSTPIGNLGDCSDRLRDTLSKCDYILAEDTRRSRILLNHFNINKPTVSFHEHSDESKITRIIDDLSRGLEIAYLTDAGTPNLSDPGGRLAQAVFEQGLNLSPIVGPSALTALISVAPFDCSNFVFLGFFPKKKGRQTMVKTIRSYDCPVFFFESPHRISKTITLLSETLPEYNILIGRELTKKFEEIIFSKLEDTDRLSKIKPTGEFVFALVKDRPV